MNWPAQLVAFIVAVAVVGLVGLQLADTAESNGFNEYLERSGDWCDERGGALYEARTIGPNGGLQCELPNGTAVRMHEVLDPELKHAAGTGR